MVYCSHAISLPLRKGEYILFSEPCHNRKAIRIAADEIKKRFGGIKWHIATEHERDLLYAVQIGRSPLISEFAWYEINVSPELIRIERKKGTTVQQYVLHFVLLFRQRTKAENGLRYHVSYP